MPPAPLEMFRLRGGNVTVSQGWAQVTAWGAEPPLKEAGSAFQIRKEAENRRGVWQTQHGRGGRWGRWVPGARLWLEQDGSPSRVCSANRSGCSAASTSACLAARTSSWGSTGECWEREGASCRPLPAAGQGRCLSWGHTQPLLCRARREASAGDAGPLTHGHRSSLALTGLIPSDCF